VLERFPEALARQQKAFAIPVARMALSDATANPSLSDETIRQTG